jgi:hypothetical protein
VSLLSNILYFRFIVINPAHPSIPSVSHLIKFNKEHLFLVYDQISLPVIMKFRHSSRYFYHTANSYVRKRVASLIHGFGLHYGRTLSKLDAFNAVIGGSVALLPILARNDEFEPEDLDIYVPERYAYELYLVLLEETYFISETSSNMHLGNPCISSVLLLTHRSNEDLCVNLIMTSSPSPVAAIIHSSSTHTMNYINKHGIFCAYPELTSNKLALSVVRPTCAQVLDLHRMVAGTMVPKFIERNILDPLQLLFRRRYQEHGFSFDNNLLAHACAVDASCPHTSRHTSDSKHLFFHFGEHMHLPIAVDSLPVYPSILQDKRPKSLSHEGCDVRWTLGGGPCDHSGRSWM